MEEAFAKHLLSMEKHWQFKEMMEFYTELCDKFKSFKNIKTSFCLNDSGDIMVRLKPKVDYVKKTLKDLKESNHMLFLDNDEEEEVPKFHDNITDASFFYYSSNGLSGNNFSDHIHYDSPFDDIVGMSGVSMNELYIFFWNNGSVWKLDLATKKRTKLSLYISEKEIQTFIVKVRTCSNKDLVCIRVRQSAT